MRFHPEDLWFKGLAGWFFCFPRRLNQDSQD